MKKTDFRHIDANVLIAIYGPPGTAKTWLADRIEAGDQRSSITLDADLSSSFRARLRAARRSFSMVIVCSPDYGICERLGFKPNLTIRPSITKRKR